MVAVAVHSDHPLVTDSDFAYVFACLPAARLLLLVPVSRLVLTWTMPDLECMPATPWYPEQANAKAYGHDAVANS